MLEQASAAVAGISQRHSTDVNICYDLLSPRLQSAFLDAACLLDGLEIAALDGIWGPGSLQDLQTLEMQGLLHRERLAPDRAWSLRVPGPLCDLAHSQADLARARRIYSAADALDILESSKVDFWSSCSIQRDLLHDARPSCQVPVCGTSTGTQEKHLSLKPSVCLSNMNRELHSKHSLKMPMQGGELVCSKDGHQCTLNKF